jgi:hypothetical protein
MELREAVAKAIHESNRIVPWDQTSQQDLAYERADAAIAAVLDALREPSEAMVDIGTKSTFTPVDEQDAELVWSNMLAAFRAEALGEG